MDKTGDGVVTYDDIKGTYNVKSHPDFQNGSKTEREILTRFLNIFEEGGVQDGQVRSGIQGESLEISSGISESICLLQMKIYAEEKEGTSLAPQPLRDHRPNMFSLDLVSHRANCSVRKVTRAS